MLATLLTKFPDHPTKHFSIYHCTSTTMFPTFALRNFACRITLFTRSNCKLCSDAKEVLSNVWDKRPFEYDEINVMEHSDQKWKNMYEFDTPVVSNLRCFLVCCIDNVARFTWTRQKNATSSARRAKPENSCTDLRSMRLKS